MIAHSDQEGRSFVIFRLGTEEYGLAIERVQSIIRYEQATPVPRAPGAVLGVVNLRGQVIPVVDLARRFGQDPLKVTPNSRIVVAEGEAGTVGLAVDAASEVVTIPLADIQPTPDSVLSPETVDVFEGVADRAGKLVILIDLDMAVPKTEYARLTSDGEAEGGRDV